MFKNIIKLIIAALLLLPSLSLAQDKCELAWKRFLKDTDYTTVSGKKLSDAIDANPDLMDAWKVVDESGIDQAIKTDPDELSKVLDKLEEIEQVGGYAKWKSLGSKADDALEAIVSPLRGGGKYSNEVLDGLKIDFPDATNLRRIIDDELVEVWQITKSKSITPDMNTLDRLSELMSNHNLSKSDVLDKLSGGDMLLTKEYTAVKSFNSTSSYEEIVWDLYANGKQYDNIVTFYKNDSYLYFDLNTLDVRGLGKGWFESAFQKWPNAKSIKASVGLDPDYPDGVARGLKEIRDYVNANGGYSKEVLEDACRNTSLFNYANQLNKGFNDVNLPPLQNYPDDVTYFIIKN